MENRWNVSLIFVKSKTLKSNTRLFFSFYTFCCLKTRPIIKANKRKFQYSLCILYMYLTEHFNSFYFFWTISFFIENRKNSELSIILSISIYTILFDFLEKYIIAPSTPPTTRENFKTFHVKPLLLFCYIQIQNHF